MIRVLPATPEAVVKVYGETPIRTMRGVVFERDGEILGCAGLYVEGGYMVMFSDMEDAVRKAPRALVKAYRQLQDIARQRGMPVLAVAEESIEASERFLEHMGFSRVDGEVFQWAG